MKKSLIKLVEKHGAKLCALAVLITSQGVNVCRGMFYQPEEPDNLRYILTKKQ